MALFSGVDERLPLLTQFLQIEDEDELTALVESVDPLKGELGTEQIPREEGEELLRLVKGFLSAWADDTTVDHTIVWGLARLFTQEDRVYALDTRDSQGEIMIPIFATGTPRARDIVFRTNRDAFVLRILSDLRNALADGKEFRRCAECRNVYLVRRGSPWCSQRCTDTSTQRERRRRKTLTAT